MGNCSVSPEDRLICCETEGTQRIEERPGLKVLLVASQLFHVMGFKAYHTSVAIGHREVFFDGGGVVDARAFWSHAWCQGNREKPPRDAMEAVQDITEIVEMGYTKLNTRDVLDALHFHFQEGSYDVLKKNCNTFSDAAIYLLTGQRLGGKFNRLERCITALEPVSTDILQMLMRKQPPVAEPDESGELTFRDDQAANTGLQQGYVMNPLAADFDVEDVIAIIDGEDGSRVKTPSDACCNRSATCCGKLQPLPAPPMEDHTSPNKVRDPVIEQSPRQQPWDPFGRSNRSPGSLVPMVNVYDEGRGAGRSFEEVASPRLQNEEMPRQDFKRPLPAPKLPAPRLVQGTPVKSTIASPPRSRDGMALAYEPSVRTQSRLQD